MQTVLIVLGVVVFVVLACWLTYKRTVRVHLTKDQKRRAEVAYKAAPFMRPRRRDAPGQALRRAVYLAWVAKRITADERNLFAKRRPK